MKRYGCLHYYIYLYGLQSVFRDLKMLPVPDSPLTNMTRSTSLNHTSFAPMGKINEHKLMEIYAFIIIRLDLNGNVVKKRFTLTKPIPYTFTLGKCIEIMSDLELNIELSNTTTTISYKFKPSLAKLIIQRFFDAKLLHCPSDRTLNHLEDLVPLQPTAKGLAIVQKFCKTIGMKSDTFPTILFTNYNSMDLIRLDRDTTTDNIVYSGYFIHVLFQKMLGQVPNIWNSYNDPDVISSNLNANIPSDDDFCAFNSTAGTSPFLGLSSRSSPSDQLTTDCQASTSPYHHRYFTNPDLDSHMQYFTSNTGVRFHKLYEFMLAGKKIVVKNCLSGKSICQWLCDCTDVFTVSQAIQIGNLFLKAKLLDPVPFSPSKANFDKFSNHESYYYTISKLGKKMSLWTKYNNLKSDNAVTNKLFIRLKAEIGDDIKFLIDKSNIEADQETTNPDAITLADTLKDPGLRYLFRQHLEAEFCVENLDAYMKLKQYETKVSILGKLLDSISIETNNNGHVASLASECISIAYNIFLTYLSSESPFALNIDYQLKNNITTMLTAPSSIPNSCSVSTYLKTPIKGTFSDIDLPSNSSSLHLQASNSEVSTINSGQQSPGILEHDDCNSVELEPVSSKFVNLVASKTLSRQEKEVSTSLTTLTNITVTFEEIKKQIFRMMEIDSFPKFIESELCKLVSLKIKDIENSNTTSYNILN